MDVCDAAGLIWEHTP